MKKNLLILLALLTLGARSAPAAEEAKTNAYPLTTCLVSGEKLGEMGEPYIFQHEGREVRFCCKNCRKDFLKDPVKYLKRLDEAVAARTAANPAPAKKAEAAGHEHHHGN